MMKENVIKKYVKDLDGLLREVKLWEKKPATFGVQAQTLLDRPRANMAKALSYTMRRRIFLPILSKRRCH